MHGFKNRERTDWVVIHCSKTFPGQRDTYGQPLGLKYIEYLHKTAGALSVGYHYLILRDGAVIETRHHATIGNHCPGFNSTSVGICLMGGVDRQGHFEPNYTKRQWRALNQLLDAVTRLYPDAEIVGHRDLITNSVENKCPSFDVAQWLAGQGTRTIHKDTCHVEPEETDPRPPPVD